MFGLDGSSLFAVATWQIIVLVYVNATRRGTIWMRVSVFELQTCPLWNTCEHAALCHWNARQIARRSDTSMLQHPDISLGARSFCPHIPSTWECYVSIQLQQDALAVIWVLIPVTSRRVAQKRVCLRKLKGYARVCPYLTLTANRSVAHRRFVR